MQEFKSPSSRLAKLFHKGRDNWKQRDARKTEKTQSIRNKSERFISIKRLLENRAKIAEEKLQTANIDTGCEKKRDSYKRASKLKNK